ncbi:MAG: hypothetical protein ACP5JJ_08165, partial [Anaerolineae bacterium]
MTERCYYDYLRLLAPPDAELLDAMPHAVPGSILLSGKRRAAQVDVSYGAGGLTVRSTFIVLGPGQSLETIFTVAASEDVLERTEDEWRYHLTVQKEPGTDAHPLDVTWRMPSDAKILRGHPEPAEQIGGILRFRLDQRADVAPEVVWNQPSFEPLRRQQSLDACSSTVPWWGWPQRRTVGMIPA